MEFLATAFQDLELANNFPNEISDKQRESVQSAVLYLCAATCDYLACGINNIRRSFLGESCIKLPLILVNFVSAAFLGPNKLVDARNRLTSAHERYMSAL